MDTENPDDATEELIPSQNEKPSSMKKNPDLLAKIGAAVFYGVSSFMITVVNKYVLTVHKFPSFQVSFGQKTNFVILSSFI